MAAEAIATAAQAAAGAAETGAKTAETAVKAGGGLAENALNTAGNKNTLGWFSRMRQAPAAALQRLAGGRSSGAEAVSSPSATVSAEAGQAAAQPAVDSSTAGQIDRTFDAMGRGIREGARNKVNEYADRAVAGENVESMLAGMDSQAAAEVRAAIDARNGQGVVATPDTASGSAPSAESNPVAVEGSSQNQPAPGVEQQPDNGAQTEQTPRGQAGFTEINNEIGVAIRPTDTVDSVQQRINQILPQDRQWNNDAQTQEYIQDAITFANQQRSQQQAAEISGRQLQPGEAGFREITDEVGISVRPGDSVDSVLTRINTAVPQDRQWNGDDPTRQHIQDAIDFAGRRQQEEDQQPNSNGGQAAAEQQPDAGQQSAAETSPRGPEQESEEVSQLREEVRQLKDQLAQMQEQMRLMQEAYTRQIQNLQDGFEKLSNYIAKKEGMSLLQLFAVIGWEIVRDTFTTVDPTPDGEQQQ